MFPGSGANSPVSSSLDRLRSCAERCSSQQKEAELDLDFDHESRLGAPATSCESWPGRWAPRENRGSDAMEKNGTSNGKGEKGTTAATAGVSKGPSPRKRRKVNHGMSNGASDVCMRARARNSLTGSLADDRTCSCSVCILSTICKSPIGPAVQGRCLGRMRLCVMFGMS
jgi:hypothetical protein